MKKKIISLLTSFVMVFTIVGVDSGVVLAADKDANEQATNATVEVETIEEGVNDDLQDSAKSENGDAEITESGDSEADSSDSSMQLQSIETQDISGTGTEEDPYLITSAEDFAAMEATGYAKLTKDITVDTPYANEYTGTFDGNGKTITLAIADYAANYAALFAKVNAGAIIKDLTIEGSITTSGNRNYIGGLVGYANASDGEIIIESVRNKATITSYRYVGGIVGYVTNGTITIRNCSNTGNITASNLYVGGIAGQLSSGNQIISNCYNAGNISGYNQVGGIVGQAAKSYANPTITNCYSTGTSTGTSSYSPTPGALIGLMSTSGIVDNCYALENTVSPVADGKDGLIGTNNSPSVTNVAYKTDTEMKSQAFATLMGSAYAYNEGGYPVFATEGGGEVVEPSEFTVSFDLNGGAIDGKTSLDDLTVEKDAKTSNPGTPTKEGYKFVGWFNGDDEYDFDTAVTESIALKAKYAPKSYKTTINVIDKSTKEAVTGYTLKLTYEAEEEDDWGDTETVTKEAKATDGVYVLDPETEYTYKVTCEGYKPLTGKFKPEGDEIDITKDLELYVITDEYTKVTNTATKFEETYVKGLGRLRATYGEDTTVPQVVADVISKYDFDTEDVSVSVETSTNTDVVGTDGKINYVKDALASPYVYVKNLTLTLKFKCGDEEVTTGEVKMQVGWDLDYIKNNMKAEADNLDFDDIRGENESADAITSDLTLPQCISITGSTSGNSMREQWSEIEWSSSDESVIKITKPTIDSSNYAATGQVIRAKEDKTVTLTAKFKANDTLLNSNLGETVDKIGYITKEFEVTVPGDPELKDDSDIIGENLEANYEGLLTDFYDKTTKVDASAVTGNIQMPKPGDLEKDGVDILTDRENQKVTVESLDEDVLTFYGYQAQVFRPLPGEEDATARYKVTITDRNTDNVLASKVFKLTIKAFEQQELDDAAALMKKTVTEDVYWNGIKGDNTSKDNVLTNLHAFKEIRYNSDGEIEYYVQNDADFSGISVDDIPGYDPMINDTYMWFRTSNKNIISYENLLVTLPETDTEVTIDSVMTYDKYSQYWEKALKTAENGDDSLKTRYADFEQFYKQPVSVTVTVGHDHTATLVHHPATEASYTSEGNAEYWQCSKCGKKFLDEEGTKVAKDSDVKIAAKPLKSGVTITSGSFIYKATSSSTVKVYKLKSKKTKSATIPAYIKVAGKKIKVIGINSKAFKGYNKFKTLTIKSPSLAKARVKNSLKGSKVKTIKVKVSSKKKVNKTYVKKYKKYFAKKNSGKRVKVK